MKLYALLITVLFIGMFLITSSCELPTTTTGLNLTDSGGDDDNKKEDVEPTPECGSRDSCDDTCDEMFYGQSERLKCSRLDFNEVNALVKVHDELKDIVDKEDLEDEVSADDFELYLSIGMDSLIRRMKGKFDDDGTDRWKTTSPNNSSTSGSQVRNSLEILSWIAENEDIAQIVLAQDTRFEIARELFKNSSDHTVTAPKKTVIQIGGANDDIVIYSEGIHKGDSGNNDTPHQGREIVSFRGDGDDVIKFVDGFVRERSSFFGSGDSFIDFALDERNNSAFEWVHNALVDLCMDATNRDKEEVEVKQCILAVYCTHRAFDIGGGPHYGFIADAITENNERTSGTEDIREKDKKIFDELEDQESIVGRIGDPEDLCQAHASNAGLFDEDRIEDLFE